MKNLIYSVFNSEGTLVARTLYVESACALASMEGEGSTIRTAGASGKGPHAIRWTEGKDGCAADSYGKTADTIFERMGSITS